MIFNEKISHLPGLKNYRSLTIVLSLLCLSGFLFTNLHAERWAAYTNTNNVTDIAVTPDKVYTGTWGGVAEYSISGGINSLPEYSKTITSVDGLVSNDIRTLAYEAGSGDLWIGTANDGITIIKTNGMQTLDTDSGLPSDKVRRIVVYQSYIFVATDIGISQFYYLPGVFFPLLLHQYTSYSTQGGLVSDDVNDIAVSPSGYLFCTTALGISYAHTDSLDIDTAWHTWNIENSPLVTANVLSISVNQNFIAMNTMTSVHRHNADPFVSDWLTWTRNSGGLQDSVFTVGLTEEDEIMVAYGVWNEDYMTLTHKSANSFGIINSSGTLINELIPPVPSSGWNIPTESIYRFVINASGVCMATWGQGYYKSGFHIENNCIGFQTISEIATDADNNIWFGSGWLGASMTRKGTRGISKWSGGIWQNFNHTNSPLTSSNMMNVAVDTNDKKWFGSWYSNPVDFGWSPGVNVYDDNDDWQWYTSSGVRNWQEGTNSWSEYVTGSPHLLNNTIADIYVDKTGNIMISSSGQGILVLDKDYNLLGNFSMPGSISSINSISFMYNSGTRYFFGLRVDNKLAIWDDSSLPIGSANHWLSPEPSKLSESFIYGVVTITNIFGEEENWIASSQGLYMWNGTDWFRYDTDIKRRKLISDDNWTNETLYYVDEERLFGSVREARPSSIFLDPFGRIWIGSLENGITMYDPETERFTNYYQGKSPLLSNYITCFGYDPIAGNLLIGTPDGLNTLETGVVIKTERHLKTVKAYPNPFIPDKDGFVRIVNMPSRSMPKGTNVCKIYDASGVLVIELYENLFARFDWNGLNSKSKKCSSGIYYFVVTDTNGLTKRGKIALIRRQ